MLSSVDVHNNHACQTLTNIIIKKKKSKTQIKVSKVLLGTSMTRTVEHIITKTHLFKYIENFTTKKKKKKKKMKVEAVLTSTYNLHLSRNKKNNVYPCNPQFYYIRFKGFKII